MPAFDHCHDQVVRALQKEGWQVEHSVTLSTEERTIIVDLRAGRHTNGAAQQILLAEVKCFPDKSGTTDLYTAIGQYIVYRAVMEDLDIYLPLYLSIPEQILNTVFDATIRRIIRIYDVKMMIVDVVQERIVQWIG